MRSSGISGLRCGLLLLVLATLTPAHSAATPVEDSAPITNPTQVAAHYREVAARPEFADSSDTSIDTRLEDWLTQWFRRLGDRIGHFKYASQMPAFESLLMTLLVVFSITVLCYVLYRLTRRRGGMEEEASNELPGPKTFRPPEFYDEEIKQAVSAGDWHTAWLATWRQFLSRLENQNLVEADRTRTNREYLAQLREKPVPNSAMALLNVMVDAYDRFIYGRATIGPTEWNDFHRHIDEAALLLHLNEKRAATPAIREMP